MSDNDEDRLKQLEETVAGPRGRPPPPDTFDATYRCGHTERRRWNHDVDADTRWRHLELFREVDCTVCGERARQKFNDWLYGSPERHLSHEKAMLKAIGEVKRAVEALNATGDDCSSPGDEEES
jgi:hypothetical protein